MRLEAEFVEMTMSGLHGTPPPRCCPRCDRQHPTACSMQHLHKTDIDTVAEGSKVEWQSIQKCHGSLKV
jgi:hypothetical protein